MKKILYKDIKLKDGTTLPKGLQVGVVPGGGGGSFHALVTLPDGRTLKMHYASIFKPPSVKQLEKWEFDGYSKTVAGKKVEPDGYDNDGFPSWLLDLGMI